MMPNRHSIPRIAHRQRRACRPAVEALEARTLLSSTPLAPARQHVAAHARSRASGILSVPETGSMTALSTGATTSFAGKLTLDRFVAFSSSQLGMNGRLSLADGRVLAVQLPVTIARSSCQIPTRGLGPSLILNLGPADLESAGQTVHLNQATAAFQAPAGRTTPRGRAICKIDEVAGEHPTVAGIVAALNRLPRRPS